ncbi:MAG: hypothetical protein JSR44_06885 [Spirochaetes bacterium]|nr:hypothetical protein [Spirochaetota bacterium]
MIIAGAVLTLVLTMFGAIFMFIDWASGSPGKLIVSIVGMSFSGIQLILAIVAFFKAKGAGMALIVMAGIMIVAGLAVQAWATTIFNVLIAGSAVLIYLGGKKNDLVSGAKAGQ